MTIQNRLKKILEIKNLSLANAARSNGLSPATLHLWMNNKYNCAYSKECNSTCEKRIYKKIL